MVLKDGDDADAAVDGVTEAHIGFVGEGIDGVFTLVRVEFVEEFSDVAGAEDAMNVDELLRVVRREIRREYAVRLAFSPEKFACGAWRRR